MKDGKDFDDVRWDDGKPTVTDFVWGRDVQTASLIRAYKDEIERLRGALERLAELDEFVCGKPQTIEEVMNYTQFVARAALGEKE